MKPYDHPRTEDQGERDAKGGGEQRQEVNNREDFLLHLLAGLQSHFLARGLCQFHQRLFYIDT